MLLQRSSGVLLHITSLGGKYGPGSLGKNAFEFVNFLSRTGTRYWQILPFNPVLRQFGYSPYASTSTFAGNPLLIDLDLVIKKFSFLHRDLLPKKIGGGDFIDFEHYQEVQTGFCKTVFTLFQEHAGQNEKNEVALFYDKHKFWLDDYALYCSLAEYFNTNNWLLWDTDISQRKPNAIYQWKEKLSDSFNYNCFVQYLFFIQWENLKNYCKETGIEIIGDIPIYVSFDSADAWANPDIFFRNCDGEPDPVAGVPPDYFSETGQRWGNPIYKWFDKNDNLNDATFGWWVERIKHLLEMVDLVRIDHFRAFESYWAIPKNEKTAIKGEWVKGPGKEFFDRLYKCFGNLPLIAEDLGIITEKVRTLRDELGLPGMKILQFAFDFNNDNDYLPHSIEKSNCVLYTGTHDNNTSNGWFYGRDVSDNLRSYIKEYLCIDNDSNFHKKFIGFAMMSNARLTIIPLQDIFGYASEFRMNTPGTMKKENWRWKMKHLDSLYRREYFWARVNVLYKRAWNNNNKNNEEKRGDKNE